MVFIIIIPHLRLCLLALEREGVRNIDLRNIYLLSPVCTSTGTKPET